MGLAELVAVSRSVAETAGRLEKIDRLAALLKRLEPGEIEIAVAYLSGSTRQGRIGVGGAAVSSAHDVAPSAAETLDLLDVDAAFARVVATTGAGSGAARAAILRELFGRATRDEQEFLIRLLFGELRQGALEGGLLEAVARASGIAAVPEVVDIVRGLPAREIILDGEAIALRPEGTPYPFQVTMRRFGRKLDVDRLRQELAITPVFFDALYLDGQPLADEAHGRRIATLGEQVPATWIVPRLVTSRSEEAAAFLARAIESGHEGVMAKAVDGAYAAGRRGQAWLKIKRTRTLDLVVLAVEWGHGRRRGTLSNLHLGARDAERGGFVMLGKTFKGRADAMLAWQTKKMLELEGARDEYLVFARPELVVAIAFTDFQAMPTYPGGV